MWLCTCANNKSPKCIYSFTVSILDLLESGLSDETVEIVSDLFLFFPFFPHFQETIRIRFGSVILSCVAEDVTDVKSFMLQHKGFSARPSAS
jgi:hypothetical protein